MSLPNRLCASIGTAIEEQTLSKRFGQGLDSGFQRSEGLTRLLSRDVGPETYRSHGPEIFNQRTISAIDHDTEEFARLAEHEIAGRR